MYGSELILVKAHPLIQTQKKKSFKFENIKKFAHWFESQNMANHLLKIMWIWPNLS